MSDSCTFLTLVQPRFHGSRHSGRQWLLLAPPAECPNSSIRRSDVDVDGYVELVRDGAPQACALVSNSRAPCPHTLCFAAEQRQCVTRYPYPT